MVRTLFAYTHVHWDREWYRPFESFRLQLLSVVNDILNELESGALSKFYLDGQAIILEDVLQLQPELAPRLENLLRTGKLYCGPWYVVCDQMLVGGESLIRNLAYGISIVSKLGPPALIGYCPDNFGHTQDLPRILNGFGIKSAVIWRGAPLLDSGPAFWWRSPDGSTVLTYHLTRGYYHTAFQELSGDVAGMEKLEKYVVDFAEADGQSSAHPYCSEVNGALLPVGGDHTEPPVNFAKVVKDLNKRLQKTGKQLQIQPIALTDFMSNILQTAGKSPNIAQTVDGELRSNRCAPMYERSYLLYSILSTRLYLKRANRLAEHALVKMCEPVSSIVTAYGLWSYPSTELHHCWKLLLRNHPHDSICGCCVDEVHRQNVTRYEEVSNLIGNLLNRAATAIAGQAQGSALSCFDADFGCNKVAIINTGSSACAAPVPFKWTRALDDKSPIPESCVQVEKRTKIDKLFSFFVPVPYYKEVEELEGWIWPGTVAALGMKVIEQPLAESESDPPHVIVRSRKLSNGMLDVLVGGDGKIMVLHMVPNEAPRTYRLNHSLRDVGDGGDSYNFDPIPDDKPIYAKVTDVSAGRRGPLVGSIILTYELELPVAAVEDHSLIKRLGTNPGKIQLLKRSSKRIKQEVTVEVSLRRGVPIVFFDTSFNNAVSDHRLEVVFETDSEVRTTLSENHFGLMQRHHGGRTDKLPVPLRHEAAPDRYPAQRFFIANGQMFFNTGLPEYGVDGSGVTITLLRAVSWLSKPQLWTRGGGAGPNVPVVEANCLGQNLTSYGWAPLPGYKSDLTVLDSAGTARAYELCDLFEGSLWATVTKRDDLPNDSLISVSNEHVRVTSMQIDDGCLILRLLNVTDEPQVATITFKRNRFSSAAEVALSGATLKELAIKNHSCTLELARHQLLTLKLALRKR